MGRKCLVTQLLTLILERGCQAINRDFERLTGYSVEELSQLGGTTDGRFLWRILSVESWQTMCTRWPPAMVHADQIVLRIADENFVCGVLGMAPQSRCFMRLRRAPSLPSFCVANLLRCAAFARQVQVQLLHSVHRQRELHRVRNAARWHCAEQVDFLLPSAAKRGR